LPLRQKPKVLRRTGETPGSKLAGGRDCDVSPVGISINQRNLFALRKSNPILSRVSRLDASEARPDSFHKSCQLSSCSRELPLTVLGVFGREVIGERTLERIEPNHEVPFVALCSGSAARFSFLTEWPESCSQLGSEEFRLFPCCEMAAFGESGVVNLLAKEAITALFSLSFHELPHQFPNLVCVGVKREVSCIEHLNLRARYVLSIPFWLAEIERKIVLSPGRRNPACKAYSVIGPTLA
jgi:hypothetical protein